MIVGNEKKKKIKILYPSGYSVRPMLRITHAGLLSLLLWLSVHGVHSDSDVESELSDSDKAEEELALERLKRKFPCKDKADCKKGGYCEINPFYEHGRGVCECEQGYFKTSLPGGKVTCTLIDECLFQDCIKECIEKKDGVNCWCHNERGRLGKYQCFKDCRDNLCQHSCKNTVESYDCLCNKGYELNLDNNRKCVKQNTTYDDDDNDDVFSEFRGWYTEDVEVVVIVVIIHLVGAALITAGFSLLVHLPCLDFLLKRKKKENSTTSTMNEVDKEAEKNNGSVEEGDGVPLVMNDTEVRESGEKSNHP